jgi:hypothetical protein
LEIDPLSSLKVAADRDRHQLTPAFVFGCNGESALEFSTLFFGGQIKQPVGRPNGDQAIAHSSHQLRRTAALDPSDPFSFGGARQGGTPLAQGND